MRLRESRLWVAAVCGLVVATYVSVSYAIRLGPSDAHDFTVHWLAARALMQGDNPYEALHVGGRAVFEGRYFYPLTATLLVVPFAWMPMKMAAAVFAAVGATLFAYQLAGQERWRLAVLLSAPMLSTAAAGQNTAFDTAAAVTPALGFLLAIKPNLGLAILAMRPSRIAIVGAIAFAALALLAFPTWPWEWLRAVTTDPGVHYAPVMVPGGLVMLAALTRWRRPEARLLAAMAVIPHTMTWYDALPLMLIPATYRQLLVLAILSHLATFVAAPFSLWYEGPKLFATTAIISLWGLYVPALLLVLRRPNRGDVPGWIERLVAQWPRWARGEPARADAA